MEDVETRRVRFWSADKDGVLGLVLTLAQNVDEDAFNVGDQVGTDLDFVPSGRGVKRSDFLGLAFEVLWDSTVGSFVDFDVGDEGVAV